ncbi:MAG: hypothetical protein EBQ66_01570 [Flavobacteriia bacterium]|nr:hypothetical protein [Flavobacteriia bacterium]
MAISTAQYVDLLFKKLQGVAKTATAAQKSASNESIASPALLRGDIVWTQSSQVPSTAQVVANVTQGYLTTSRIECTADTTVPTIGGIYPTWLTNLQYWIPQEFGSTWPVKVWVDTAGAANPTVTGTQIFSTGIGGVGEFYFDTQAGVLNFIGETIPSTLTAGKSIFITGYRYVGQLGVTNLPSANIGNIQITGNTIATLNTNGDLVFDPNGTGQVVISSNLTVSGTIYANISGNITVPGTNGDILFNAANVLNASSALNFNYSSNILSVAGNIIGSNVTTGGLVFATGNITGGNITTVGTANIGTLAVTGNANVIGNVSGSYFLGNGSLLTGIDATSIQNGNSNVRVAANSNVTVGVAGIGNIAVFANTGVYITGVSSASGNITSAANISGGFILGNGAFLTGIDATSIQNGNSNVRVTANGNVTVGVAGSSNVVVFTSTGEYITGLLSVTGNVTAGNVTTANVNSTSALTVATGSNGNLLLSATGTGIVKITGGTGFVVPVGNTAQRPSPVDDGTLRLNSTLNDLEVYNSGSWQLVGSGSTGNITVTDQQITPDGTNTVYTLNQEATAPSIMVAINGVTQTPAEGYTVTGNIITFSEAPLVSDAIDIRFLTSPTATPGAIYNSAANSSVQVNDVPEISFTVNNAIRTKITANGIVDISTGRSIKMPLYTVAQADALTGRTEGEMIYVQNGDSGAACLAVFAGGVWKRVVLGAAISG